MPTVPGTPSARQKPRTADQVHRRMLTATAIAAAVIGSSATAASSVSASPRPALRPHTTTRSSRPDRADWEKIKAAARLRDLGLAPHGTAHFRSFVGFLGLSQLEMIRPLAPGRCEVALTYLYGNLLDLRDAEPGENWAPFRRFVAKEPSIRACAPRRATTARHGGFHPFAESTRALRGSLALPPRRDRRRTPSRAHHTTPVGRRNLTSAAPSPGVV